MVFVYVIENSEYLKDNKRAEMTVYKRKQLAMLSPYFPKLDETVICFCLTGYVCKRLFCQLNDPFANYMQYASFKVKSI